MTDTDERINEADERFISACGCLWGSAHSILSVTLALGLDLQGATTSSVFIFCGPAVSLSIRQWRRLSAFPLLFHRCPSSFLLITVSLFGQGLTDWYTRSSCIQTHGNEQLAPLQTTYAKTSQGYVEYHLVTCPNTIYVIVVIFQILCSREILPQGPSIDGVLIN